MSINKIDYYYCHVLQNLPLNKYFQNMQTITVRIKPATQPTLVRHTLDEPSKLRAMNLTLIPDVEEPHILRLRIPY